VIVLFKKIVALSEGRASVWAKMIRLWDFMWLIISGRRSNQILCKKYVSVSTPNTADSYQENYEPFIVSVEYYLQDLQGWQYQTYNSLKGRS
jgi:hypothetical protein